MSHARRNKREGALSPELAEQIQARLQEGLSIIMLALSVFFLLSLMSYHQTDPSWSHTGKVTAIANMAGRVGAWVADLLFYLFGYLAYCFPIMLAIRAIINFRHRDPEDSHIYFLTIRLIGFIATLIAGTGLASLYLHVAPSHLPLGAGGILGQVIGFGLMGVFNLWGTSLLLLAAFLAGATLATGISWAELFDQTGAWALTSLEKVQVLWRAWREHAAKEKPVTPDAKIEPRIMNQRVIKAKAEKRDPLIEEERVEEEEPKELIIEVKRPTRKKRAKPKEEEVEEGEYPIPSLDLLSEETSEEDAVSHEDLEEMSLLVEQRLAEFGVTAKVVSVHPGPVITRFELDLAAGIKVSRVTALAKDVARSLSVLSVRVVEVIPGKPHVGLEVPNPHRQIVRLREVLDSDAFSQAHSPLSLALGKDIAGHPVVVDLAKMPHLLAAGTTGSGKSVSLNAMLLSLLYKATPEDLRLILIDPKMLELSIYEGIPHLLTPVVTNMKDAANALRWAVAEMERRYRLMARMGVRNIIGYNNAIESAEEPIEDPFQDPQAEERIYLTKLPYVVIVIDEFADMMMVVGKKVEELIARVAQKARAAGIHLLLATQRPSVDVITGLIKANIPTRIAFQVSSRIDSRTILDQQGAEQLLGNGDMLYLPPGTGVPVRVHGAYVADEEVHSVVEAWRSIAEPSYMEDVIEERNDSGAIEVAEGEEEELDELYDKAVAVVTESGRASISFIQRRLKIGYNRAARIMEQMEMGGVVSPADTNGSREVLAEAAPGDE